MLKSVAHFVSRCAALTQIVSLSAAMAIAGVSAAKAAIIFDNITGTSSPGGYLIGQYPGGGVYAIGFDFTVPSGAGPAVGGAIGVEYSSGVDQLDLAIAENVGGVVGPTVATATLTGIPSTLTILDFSLAAPVALEPNHSYWLIATADTSSAVFYWWTPDIPPGVYDQAVSVNGGLFASGTNQRPGQFAIFSAPEPSTWTMLLIGFGAAAFAMRRASLRPRLRA